MEGALGDGRSFTQKVKTMWKHELIEAFSYSYGRQFVMAMNEHQDIHKFLDLLVEQLRNSEVFYFGKDEDTCNPTVKKEAGKRFTPYMKTPYRSVLYEVETSRKMPLPSGEAGICSTKSAFLVAELDGIQACLCFDLLHVDGQLFWSICPVFGLTKKDDPDIIQLTRLYEYEQEEDNEMGEEEEFRAALSKATVLNDIINCQNVVTKDVMPPEKLNRKRIRNGKLPLYSYKILEVVKGKPKTKDAGSVPWDYKSPETVRFHLCRGHFKTYTEDSKLFGKYTGTFWWNPQSRGDRGKGIIEKEYSVKQL